MTGCYPVVLWKKTEPCLLRVFALFWLHCRYRTLSHGLPIKSVCPFFRWVTLKASCSSGQLDVNGLVFVYIRLHSSLSRSGKKSHFFSELNVTDWRYPDVHGHQSLSTNKVITGSLLSARGPGSYWCNMGSDFESTSHHKPHHINCNETFLIGVT